MESLLTVFMELGILLTVGLIIFRLGYENNKLRDELEDTKEELRKTKKNAKRGWDNTSYYINLLNSERYERDKMDHKVRQYNNELYNEYIRLRDK